MNRPGAYVFMCAVRVANVNDYYGSFPIEDVNKSTVIEMVLIHSVMRFEIAVLKRVQKFDTGRSTVEIV